MKYKILIVDDEKENLRLLERLFRRTHDVFEATSGAEGIKMLELHDIELIISDQRMPGMTGIEFLKLASQLRPNTVRIILTGYTDVNDLVDVINSGVVYKYITKPWVNEDLIQTVARGLGLFEKAARQVPMAAPWLECAACQQHLAVALEDALDAGDRVGPVPLSARVAAQVIRLVCEAPTTAGTETPPYERTHGGT
jgi:CheY-like chemotaxis protein